MKTERVEWLLAHIGELEGDDLKEAEMIKQFYEIQDDEPVAMDRPEHQRTDISRLPGGTPVEVVWTDQPPAEPNERDIRLAQLEAVTKDLFAKIAALETRLGVGKD